MAPPKTRRPGFSRRAQYGLFFGYVLAGIGAVAGIVLLILSTANPPAFAVLRGTVAELTAPVSSLLANAESAGAAVPAAIGHHFDVMHDNAALRIAVKRDHSLLMRARTLAYDNRRLRHLLAVRERSRNPVVAARLISSSASSTRRFAVLNAGWRQNVRGEQPVSGPEGLIGRILESGPDTARVLLLGDPESTVPVRRTRDGAPATANGRGDGLLEIHPISLGDARFQVGDVLVTSGIGGLYPPGIPVARIVSRSRDGALAKPFEAPDTLDYALVQRAFFAAPPLPAPPAIP